MKFEQIRNATIRIEYDGTTVLIDPWFAPKYTTGSFAILNAICFVHRRLGIKNTRYLIEHCETMKVTNLVKRFTLMPLCVLPKPVSEINKGVDAYLVTHIHADHVGIGLNGKVGIGFDKNIPVYAQNKGDAKYLAYSGLKKVNVIEESFKIGNAEIIKTKAIHGTKIPCGDACGYIFRSPEEKTLYVAGDTIWCPEVEEILKKYQPDVIVCNTCAAELANYGRLIMDDNDLYEVYKACPNAKIIASHMDTVTHATLTRKTLHKRLKEKGIDDKILMPDDGESYLF